MQASNMLYISVDQTTITHSDEEVTELLELNLEDVHVAINLVNNEEEVNMGRYPRSATGGRDHAEAHGQHLAWEA